MGGSTSLDSFLKSAYSSDRIERLMMPTLADARKEYPGHQWVEEDHRIKCTGCKVPFDGPILFPGISDRTIYENCALQTCGDVLDI